MSNEELMRFAALHKHWIAADAVQHHLRRSMRSAESEETGLPVPLKAMAELHSTFAVLGVWYGLLYVVIERYRDLDYRDEAIDAVLANEAMVSALRRFRNATFHFQATPFSNKLIDFLTAESSEIWIRELNRAFRHFFEAVGEIPQWLNAVRAQDLKSGDRDSSPAVE
jgi:hypothetical protein